MSTGLIKVRHGSECQSAVENSLLEPEDSGSELFRKLLQCTDPHSHIPYGCNL